jgi:hypothetical protein
MQHQQEQQKNTMVQLGLLIQLVLTRPTSTYDAGAGTQTAALVFGGEPVTAATEEYEWFNLDSCGTVATARIQYQHSGFQTAALAFGGYGWYRPIQEQQKNMMELLGQHHQEV